MPITFAPFRSFDSVIISGSTRPSPGKNHERRPEQDPQIEPDGPPINVREVQFNHFLESQGAAPADLPKSGEPRHNRQPRILPLTIEFDLIRERWARTNQAHLARDDIEQLG